LVLSVNRRRESIRWKANDEEEEEKEDDEKEDEEKEEEENILTNRFLEKKYLILNRDVMATGRNNNAQFTYPVW